MSEEQNSQTHQENQVQSQIDDNDDDQQFDADLLDDINDAEVEQVDQKTKQLLEEEDILFRVRDPDEEVQFYYGEDDSEVQADQNNQNSVMQNQNDVNEVQQNKTLDLNQQEQEKKNAMEKQIQEANNDDGEEFKLDDDLELLCNQVEADQFKTQRQKDIKKMNKRMDEKLENLRMEKLKKFFLQHLKEKYTGLICKTRMLKEEDVDIYISGREFIPIETLDLTVQSMSDSSKEPKQMIRSFFTIGVVIDVSGPFQSKNNKRYTIAKVSDLEKYDMSRVKRSLISKFGNDPAMVKTAEKSFNSNGYKMLKLMAFEEALTEASKLQAGTIIGIVNPKPMKANPEYGFSFLLDAAASIFRIGYSEDLTFCKGQGNMTTSGFFNNSLKLLFKLFNAGISGCKHFLNKSVELQCDTHKLISQQTTMNKIKSHRNVMQSEFVDLNQLRLQNSKEEQERRLGAFGANGMRQFKKVNKPRIQLSPTTLKRQQAMQDQEKKLYESFLKDRTGRAEAKKPNAFLSNIRCNETAHLGRACIPGAKNTEEKPSSESVAQSLSNTIKPKFELKTKEALFDKNKPIQTKPQKVEDDDDFDLEFTDLKENKNNGNSGFSIKGLLGQGNPSKKFTYDEKFGNQSDNKGDINQENIKRRQIQQS